MGPLRVEALSDAGRALFGSGPSIFLRIFFGTEGDFVWIFF